MTGFRTGNEKDHTVRDGEVQAAPLLFAAVGECPPGKPYRWGTRESAEYVAKKCIGNGAEVWEGLNLAPQQTSELDRESAIGVDASPGGSLAESPRDRVRHDSTHSPTSPNAPAAGLGSEEPALTSETMGVSGAAGGRPDQQPASPASAPQEPDGCSKAADEPTEEIGLDQTGAAADETDCGTTSPDPRRAALQDGQRQGPTPGAPGAHLALGRVHCGDCLELIYRLESASVDFLFADLPYGITANKWDKRINLTLLWRALYHACKPAAALIFTAVQPFASELIHSNPNAFRFEMIWKKNIASGFLNSAKRPLRIHENVLLFWREEPVYNPQKTSGHPLVRVTPSQRAQAKHSKNYGDQEHLLKTEVYESSERYPNTVLEIDCIEQHDPARRHPTQKPESLVEYFLRTYTAPGDLILDPVAGSGSTLCAAKGLGRKCIGFDLDPESVEKANDALVSRLGFGT